MQPQNETWAYAIIDQLVQQGITSFYIAPGSRSTSLVLAVDAHKETTTEVFYDERALGFMALGRAKAENNPSAIIVTSGSALANLYPATVEAFQGNTPLVFLTADRPYEFLNCGQNQAIDQKNFFSPYVHHFLDLPTIEENYLDLDYLKSSIGHAVYTCKKKSGPIQINCPFRKPFFSPLKTETKRVKAPLFSSPQYLPCEDTVKNIAKKLEGKNGLIVLSQLERKIDIEPILSLAEKLGFPIFADPLSPISQYPNNKNVINHFELLLKMDISINVDVVLQFGDRFISQALLDALQKNDLCDYIHIAPNFSFYDPIRKITQKIETSPSVFASMLKKNLVNQEPSSLLVLLKEKDLQVEKVLENYFKEHTFLTENSIVYHLAKNLQSLCNFFFANSMPIRDCLTYFHPKKKAYLFANRGASGIDGNLSTTIGIHQAGLSKKTFGIIGDQATLHDLNALSSLKGKKHTPHFLIFNNQGGGIFSHLPIKNKKGVFEKYFQAKHDHDFQYIAKQFNLSYKKVSLKSEIPNFNSADLPTFIEFVTCTERNISSQNEILERIKEDHLSCV